MDKDIKNNVVCYVSTIVIFGVQYCIWHKHWNCNVFYISLCFDSRDQNCCPIFIHIFIFKRLKLFSNKKCNNCSQRRMKKNQLLSFCFQKISIFFIDICTILIKLDCTLFDLRKAFFQLSWIVKKTITI